MDSPNFERMIRMASEVFDAKNDPDQLDVDEHVISRLLELHPASVSAFNDANGPAIWILLIPTTTELMEGFLSGKINEQQLFEQTKPGDTYTCVYLCSAMVLEEYRRQGRATQMTCDAIHAIQKDHPITALFVWPFNEAGRKSAERIAGEVGMELRVKMNGHM